MLDVLPGFFSRHGMSVEDDKDPMKGFPTTFYRKTALMTPSSGLLAVA